MKNKRSCEIKMKVPFSDLDPMQVVWHGNYLRYFDTARFELFDSFGVDLYTYDKQTEYIFPVIKTFTKYIHSLKHRDEFICKAEVVDVHVKIVVDFEISLAKNGKICAKGRGEQVAVKMPEKEMMLEIPEYVRRAFGFTS